MPFRMNVYMANREKWQIHSEYTNTVQWMSSANRHKKFGMCFYKQNICLISHSYTTVNKKQRKQTTCSVTGWNLQFIHTVIPVTTWWGQQRGWNWNAHIKQMFLHFWEHFEAFNKLTVDKKWSNERCGWHAIKLQCWTPPVVAVVMWYAS